ncbi:MAG: hypothetical protein LWY06_09155 [Firmicutes bacterium]|nr:hypothetical protein [Bacillota bacterium]
MDSLGNIRGVNLTPEFAIHKQPANVPKTISENLNQVETVSISSTTKGSITDGFINPHRLAENNKTQATDTVSSKQEVYGNINGWIGKNSANLSLRQIQDSINTDGWVGSASVHLSERKHHGGSTVSGTIHNHTEGFKDVNIDISGVEGMRTLSGWSGRDNVFLTENGSFSGGTEISGRIGSKDINIRQENRNGNFLISGEVRDSMSFGSERIWLSGSQSPAGPGVSLMSIIPALTIISS